MIAPKRQLPALAPPHSRAIKLPVGGGASVLVLFVLLHLGVLAGAIWSLRSQSAWFFASGVLVLALYPLGFFFSGLIMNDGAFSGLDFFLLGPLYPFLMLGLATAKAPVWAVSFIAVAIAAAAAVWRLVGRRRQNPKLSAIAGIIAGLAIGWIVSEITLSVYIHARAVEQFAAFCNYRRSPVPVMIAFGMSEYNGSHARLEAGHSSYLWSFRSNAWVEREACSGAKCYCMDWGEKYRPELMP